MSKHEKIAAVLNAGLGIIGVIGALIVAVTVAGGGMLSGDPEAIRITAVVAGAISGFLLLLSVPLLVGGIAFLYGKEWARMLLLIFAAVQLINIPFGTLVGAYTLWALLKTDSKEFNDSPGGTVSG